MTNLVPSPQNSTAIRQTLSELSPDLKSLLGVEPCNLTAVSEITSRPALLAEVKAALPAIKANAMAPASHDDIRRIIGARFATYRQTERSEGEWALFWADYLAVLDGLSVTALEAAMDVILRDPTIEFLPKPAKIADLAKTTPNKAVRAYGRAKGAIQASLNEKPLQLEGFPKFPEETLEARRAMSEEVRRSVGIIARRASPPG